MIRLSNGHRFNYLVASGALAFDGKGWFWEYPLRWVGLIDPKLFTVVTKTLTYEPRRGNLKMYWPWGCVRLIKGGAVNAVGLTNPGFDWWCRTIGPTMDSKRLPIIVSVMQDTPERMERMANRLKGFDIVGVELNASCPNTHDQAELIQNEEAIVKSCKILYSCSGLPVLLKLSVLHNLSLANKVSQWVEAFDVNSVPWKIVFPDKPSPLAHLGGGGVSGKPAQPFVWGFTKKLVETTQVPVIGCSIWEYEDIFHLSDMGVSAFSFGAVHIPYPWRPTAFVQRFKKEHY